MLRIANEPEFRNLPPSQIVPRLADRGIYVASVSSFYRVLERAKLTAHRGHAKEPEERAPVVRYATKPNQVWSWDITYLRGPVRGEFFYLYMVTDIYSRKVVASGVHDAESAEVAADLVRRAALRESVPLDQLTLHSDNGGPMRASKLLATLRALGIAASFTRPRVSDDNAFSEALFRTLKYRPGFPRNGFRDLAHAERWAADFVRWYHTEHLHSGIRFIRPIDRHDGREQAILHARERLWSAAKARRPERWGSRATRNWEPAGRVSVRARPAGEEGRTAA